MCYFFNSFFGFTIVTNGVLNFLRATPHKETTKETSSSNAPAAAKTTTDTSKAIKIHPTVDGWNPKQPPGMVLKPCK